jgi:hypothetical protein
MGEGGVWSFVVAVVVAVAKERKRSIEKERFVLVCLTSIGRIIDDMRG